MKHFTLLLSFILSLSAFSQAVLTDTEVFDFEVGDFFQYRKWDNWTPNSRYYDHTILSKSFNADSTEVTYVVAESTKHITYLSGSVPYSEYFTKDTLQLIFPRLDEPIDSFIARSMGGFPDTTNGGQIWFENDTLDDLCDVRSRRFVHDNQYDYSHREYGKGLGFAKSLAVYSGSAGGSQSWYYHEMRGYVKNGDTCGFISSTSLGGNESTPSTVVEVYPNPSTGVIYVQASEAFDTYSLITLSGMQLVSGDIKGNTVNFSDQPNGVYVLVLLSKEQHVKPERVRIVLNE